MWFFRSTWKGGTLHFSFILIVCHSFVTFLWRKLYACRIEKTVLKLAVVYNTMGFSTHKFSNKSHHPRHAKSKDNGPMHIQIGLGTGTYTYAWCGGVEPVSAHTIPPLISGCPKVNNKNNKHTIRNLHIFPSTQSIDTHYCVVHFSKFVCRS